MVNSSLILGKDGKLYAVGPKEILIFNEKDSEKITKINMSNSFAFFAKRKEWLSLL